MKNKILILLSIIFFLISAFIFRHYFSIFYFQNDTNKIAINIETKKDLNDIFICFNENCDKMSYLNKMYSYNLNQENPLFYNGEINKVELISDKSNIEKDINSISIFSGKEFKYIDNINLKKDTINFNNTSKTSYLIPFNFNHKTLLQKVSVYFESIFYNWYFYILSYVFILFYFLSKKKINIEIKYPILIILAIGFLLRYSHINFVPLWNDELYTVHFISDKVFNIKNAFLDPGNPPLFFIISNLWLLKFNNTITEIRLLPLIIGMIQIYSIYYILDKILNRKTALISAFLSAINIFIIVQSNEIRSYILSMTLILWGGYFFYRLYQNFNKKNLICYFLFSVLLINIHFYTFIYVLFNWLVGLFLFKKEKIKFIISNIIAFLTFIPYFLITMVNSSFNKDFNTWITKPNLFILKSHVLFYFGKTLFLIITIAFSIYAIHKYLKKSIEKKIFLYNVLVIAFIFSFACIISLTIKPILFERYFSIFLPLLIINTAILIAIPYKIQFISIIVLLFSINMPKYENFNLFSNIHFLCKYASVDKNNIDKNYKPLIVITDKIEYIKNYPEIKKEDILISNLGTREDKDLIQEYKKEIKEQGIKNKKILLYVPEICINSKIKYSKDIHIQKISTTILPVYKIFLDNL